MPLFDSFLFAGDLVLLADTKLLGRLQRLPSAAEYRDIPPVITSLIARLERELKDSLDELKTNVAPGYIKPREIRLNYVSQDGQEAVYSNGELWPVSFPLIIITRG